MEQYKDSPFTDIDLHMFHKSMYIKLKDEVIYKEYINNTDIPYIQKILKRKNELPEIWYNEKSLNSELFHINYSIEEKKYLDEILINICYG